MNEDAFHAAATTLAEARRARRRIEALAPAQAPRDEAAGYRLQQRLHEVLESAGHGRVAGHKIGCTTPVMQRYLGIDQPCAGGVFDRTVQHDGATVPASDFVRVGVECELAVALSQDIDPGNRSHDALSSAIGACMAAMEIVDDRYQDYTTIGVMTLIADDFFNAGCVLGAARSDWRSLDLAALRGTMWINGVEAGSGVGADIMAHPLNALAWLVGRYADLGMTLRAGQFVLLGSLVQTQWLKTGDKVRIDVDGLGGATLEIR